MQWFKSKAREAGRAIKNHFSFFFLTALILGGAPFNSAHGLGSKELFEVGLIFFPTKMLGFSEKEKKG